MPFYSNDIRLSFKSMRCETADRRKKVHNYSCKVKGKQQLSPTDISMRELTEKCVYVWRNFIIIVNVDVRFGHKTIWMSVYVYTVAY